MYVCIYVKETSSSDLNLNVTFSIKKSTHNWTKSKLVDKNSTKYAFHFLVIICSKYQWGIKHQFIFNSRIFTFFQNFLETYIHSTTVLD